MDLSRKQRPNRQASRLNLRTRRGVRFRKPGGSLGLSASDTPDLMRQIERGFSFETLVRLEFNTGVSHALLASVIGIPERTLARRKAAGKLKPDESERLLRVSNLFERCVELFEAWKVVAGPRRRRFSITLGWATCPWQRCLNTLPKTSLYEGHGFS